MTARDAVRWWLVWKNVERLITCRGPSRGGPGAPLGFVDPVFDEARGGDVIVTVANLMRCAQVGGKFPVVGEQFGKHDFCGKRELIVVSSESSDHVEKFIRS